VFFFRVGACVDNPGGGLSMNGKMKFILNFCKEVAGGFRSTVI
jgi:hypothetical protein